MQNNGGVSFCQFCPLQGLPSGTNSIGKEGTAPPQSENPKTSTASSQPLPAAFSKSSGVCPSPYDGQKKKMHGSVDKLPRHIASRERHTESGGCALERWLCDAGRLRHCQEGKQVEADPKSGTFPHQPNAGGWFQKIGPWGLLYLEFTDFCCCYVLCRGGGLLIFGGCLYNEGLLILCLPYLISGLTFGGFTQRSRGVGEGHRFTL